MTTETAAMTGAGGHSGNAVVVENLSVEFTRGSLFPSQRSVTHAVRNVSFSVAAGSSLALVGESGCGKTTLGRAIAGLQKPTRGSVTLPQSSATTPSRNSRRSVQLIFQNPHASLNPKLTVGSSIAEVRKVYFRESGRTLKSKVADYFELVGLDPRSAGRYPHQFSGGQKQRLVIARALAAEPDVLVCDEPTSALDVSIQSQILNLLNELRSTLGLSYIFISHDLAAVRRVAEEIAVMYLGSIVEQGSLAKVYADPQHPYTAALLSSAPGQNRAVGGRERIVLSGELPSPNTVLTGCAFRGRCWLYASLGNPERCRDEAPVLPALRERASVAACHFSEAMSQGIVQTSPTKTKSKTKKGE